MTAPRLDVRRLSKTFRPVRVLDAVDLSVAAGEVHGLAGQNGSGKSTLIKILTGVHTPDPGAEYHVDGQPVRLPVQWPQVHAAGVSVVHQDLGLIDGLSIAENVCVGGFPRTRVTRRIDRVRRDQLAERTLARLGVELDPTRPVAGLTAAERAEVAIARALRDRAPGAGLIILDEATRSLTGEDLDRIHALLRRIAADGGSALMISHSLSELVTVTDRLTILRDGRVVGAALDSRGLTQDDVARRMVGRDLTADERRPPAPRRTHSPSLVVSGLCGGDVRDVGFEVADGEVLGITGLPGNGHEQIPYLLTGAARAEAGTARTATGSVDLTRAGVGGCTRAGIVLVPERRDRDGLALDQSVRDNLCLPALNRRGKPWFVARRWQNDVTEQFTHRLGITPNAPALLVKQLSGGNQQKVLLAKWLSVGPSVLVLHEPTQAVDVGARQDILRTLRQAADDGMAVVMVSSIPEDLALGCDRVLLYRPGSGLTPATSTSADALIGEIYAADAALAGGPS